MVTTSLWLLLGMAVVAFTFFLVLLIVLAWAGERIVDPDEG